METVWTPGTPGVQKTEGGRKDPWLEPLRGAQRWDTLTSDVWSPGLREDRLLLFRASVWPFVAAAQEAHAAGGQLPALI